MHYLFLAQMVERLTVVVIINQIVIGSIPIEEKKITYKYDVKGI
jgi:hypothetical protein